MKPVEITHFGQKVANADQRSRPRGRDQHRARERSRGLGRLEALASVLRQHPRLLNAGFGLFFRQGIQVLKLSRSLLFERRQTLGGLLVSCRGLVKLELADGPLFEQCLIPTPV